MGEFPDPNDDCGLSNLTCPKCKCCLEYFMAEKMTSHNNKWWLAMVSLLDEVAAAYTYHHKMEAKHIDNNKKWLIHNDAKAQCENLENQIKEILSRHGLILPEEQEK